MNAQDTPGFSCAGSILMCDCESEVSPDAWCWGSAKTETGLGLTGRPGRQRIPEVLLEAVRYPLGMQETVSVPKVLLLITNMGEQLL